MNTTQTTAAAAASMATCAAKQRARVLAAIAGAVNGLTDDEGQALLEMEGSSCRPRRIELQTSGRIRSTGETRKTRSGRLAVAWEAI